MIALLEFVALVLATGALLWWGAGRDLGDIDRLRSGEAHIRRLEARKREVSQSGGEGGRLTRDPPIGFGPGAA